MAELETLVVRIEADIDAFKRSLTLAERETAGSTGKMARSFAELEHALDGSARNIGGAQGGFDLQTFDRALSQANALGRAARSLGGSFTAAFQDAVIGGESLRGTLQGLIQDISRIGLRTFVSGPLTSFVQDLTAGLFHGGGTAGVTAVQRRAVPAALFSGAPRFAGGGVAGLQPAEIPAILHRGETVRTAAQEAALAKSQGGSEINFHAGAIVIQTPDPQSFMEARAQIEASLGDAVRRGRRLR